MNSPSQNERVNNSEIQTDTRSPLFSAEEIQNISALGDVLRQIRARLKSEGISIEKERIKLMKRLKKS